MGSICLAMRQASIRQHENKYAECSGLQMAACESLCDKLCIEKKSPANAGGGEIQMMKKFQLNVEIEVTNKGCASEFYSLCVVEPKITYSSLYDRYTTQYERTPIQYAPTWKTRKGAERWAIRNNFNVIN